mmetsp:Transcript_9489/g.25278  ORF Transcript_9489/g.25278 Transcript_9489/m.25278 type:complete len:139 (+) Transcript_9489:1223-1639(+)
MWLAQLGEGSVCSTRKAAHNLIERSSNNTNNKNSAQSPTPTQTPTQTQAHAQKQAEKQAQKQAQTQTQPQKQQFFSTLACAARLHRALATVISRQPRWRAFFRLVRCERVHLCAAERHWAAHFVRGTARLSDACWYYA